MNIFKNVGITSAISVLCMGVVGVSSAAPALPVVQANVEVPEKVGRSTSEYFYSPIIGFNYQDVTSIDENFLADTTRFLQEFNLNDGGIPVDHTELGGIVGLLIDGQYQIISTSYWRAGFQTGLVYMSPVDSEFTLAKNNCPSPGHTGPCRASGTLEISAVSIPMLFTFSRYAVADRYITTFKLGPMITHHMYDLDFEDFELATTNENQVFLQVGIDGRYRLGQSSTFLLTGFMGNLGLFGGNNGNISAVNSSNSIGMYIGVSFS